MLFKNQQNLTLIIYQKNLGHVGTLSGTLGHVFRQTDNNLDCYFNLYITESSTFVPHSSFF